MYASMHMCSNASEHIPVDGTKVCCWAWSKGSSRLKYASLWHEPMKKGPLLHWIQPLFCFHLRATGHSADMMPILTQVTIRVQ